ncbi:MAG: type II toxin-antitoxin system PrlF family antitoxin [Gammaproteobacteria bacterium]
MMAKATLTSKGQTTIPQEIRVYLGLHTGDKVEFLIEDDGRVILAPLTTDIKELKGMLPKPEKPITIEQMKRAIAKRGAGL